MPTMLDRTKKTGSTGRRAAKLTHMMTAAAIDRFGGPEVITIRALPVPEIAADEVLIALDTAGVGLWDAAAREGFFAARKPRFPIVLGTDGAGIVAAVGARIRRLEVGDKVYAYNWNYPKGGFYCEYVAVPAERAGHVPKRLDLMHAGAIATTGLTALQGVEDALRLKRDETVIIHGASGGVGTLAVQFAKLRGARLLATASGQDGVELVRDMGADVVVDGKHAYLEEKVRAFAPDGADAVLAFAGGDALEWCLDALNPGGRLAFPNGVAPKPKKRRGVTFISYDAVADVRAFRRLNFAVEATKLKVPIAESFALRDARKAHEHLAEGHVLGKIVLRVRQP
jgi:NADPH:quinone reductase-like Zn-dependent oxidoreductase